MSCFTICDGCNCKNNEGNSTMYSIDSEVSVLISNTYSDSSVGADDLCEECVNKIAKDENLNTRIGVGLYNELVLANSSDCVATLKEWDNG